MNIEETQRVNKLAKELQSHGIASSSQEAFAKAEEMIHGKEQKEEPEARKSPESSETKRAQELQLIRSSIQELNAAVESAFSNIKELAVALGALKREVAEAKAQNARMQQAQASPVQENISQEKKTDNEEKDMKHNTKSSYAEKDVAVDKIFYFGNK